MFNDDAVDLMKIVRSSLETIRNMLGDGAETEESRAQIQQLEQLEQLLMDQASRLDAINQVLEEFNYSVAHELFAPLRRISGFTQEIRRRCIADLESEGIGSLDSILESAQRMNELIDALMQLSRLSHIELQPAAVELSTMASGIARELELGAPQRPVAFSIKPELRVTGDATLLNIALRKLFDNAWKYTAKAETAVIEFGSVEIDAKEVFYILHDAALFPGHGIGLTAVKRIIERHGGRIWAEGIPEKGAAIYFTL